MGSYILNFTVYTMAMCGLIVFALFVYKKFAQGCFSSKKSNFLNVEDTLSLAPRKLLYVIRAGEERFLVASDADKTCLISKLKTNETANFETQLHQVQKNQQNLSKQSEQLYHQTINETTFQKQKEFKENTKFIGIDDLPTIVDFPQNQKNAKSGNVIKSMISRVKD